MRLAAQHIRARCGRYYSPGGGGERHFVALVDPLIDPFFERTVGQGFTYGLSSAGYDVRIAEKVHLWPGKFVLASTMERFIIPTDLTMEIKDKSSWARRGLAVQNTIAEPGWSGFLTLELTNHGEEPLHIHPGTPIAQVVFDLLLEPTHQPYKGRYQDQPAGAQPAIDAKDGDQ